MPKKKRKTETHSIKSYYNQLLSHSGVTIQDDYHKYLKRLVILDTLILLISIALLTLYIRKDLYDNQPLVDVLRFIYLPISLYSFVACLTYTIYHFISISFEKKNKYELSLACAQKGYKLVYYTMFIIHFIWIVTAYLIILFLQKLRLDELKEAVVLLLYSYFLLFFAGLYIIYFGLGFLNTLDLYLNNHITVKTYLFGIVLAVILLCRYVSSLFMKLLIPPSLRTIRSKKEKILKQYSLLNAYLTFLITIILKALSFDCNEQLFVDAFFYTSGIITLFTKLRSDMQRC